MSENSLFKIEILSWIFKADFYITNLYSFKQWFNIYNGFVCSQYLPLIILREINYNALTNHWLTNKSKQSQTFLDRWNKWSKLPKFKLNVWQPSTSRIFAEDFHFLIITHACPLLGEHRTRCLYWLVWLHDPDYLYTIGGCCFFKIQINHKHSSMFSRTYFKIILMHLFINIIHQPKQWIE